MANEVVIKERAARHTWENILEVCQAVNKNVIFLDFVVSVLLVPF